jgi:hypothetical protein
MEKEIAALKAQLAEMEATQVALMIAVGSMLAKHPNYSAANLHMTTLAETQLATGALGKLLTPAQKQYAADVVEWIQTVVKKTDEQGPQTLLTRFQLKGANSPDAAKE